MKKSNKLLLGFIGLVFVISSLVAVLYFNVTEQIIRYYYKDSFRQIQNKDQHDNKTVDWVSYENNEIGIKFKYPKSLGKVETSKISNRDKNAPSYLKGEKTTIVFENDDLIYIAAHTSDYEGFMDPGAFVGNNNIESDCSNPLEYDNKGNVCKIIDIGGEKAIWKNIFSEIECSSYFGTKIYFNNNGSSSFKGVSILFYLDNRSEIYKLYNNCTDKIGNDKAFLEASRLSRNIMKTKNLSEKDKQRIDAVNEIISTFEFIK